MNRPADALKSGSLPRLRSRSVSKSVSATSLFLRTQLWVWPLIAAALIAGLGFWLKATVGTTMKAQMTDELQVLLNADVAALRILYRAHEAVTTIAANDPDVRRLVGGLVARGDQEAADLLRAPELAQLRSVFKPWLSHYEYHGFRIIDRNGRIIAAWRDLKIGGDVGREEAEVLPLVFSGKATISRPRPSVVPLTDTDGKERAGVPTLFVLAPIRDDNDQIIAVLGFRMRTERTLTKVLNVARFGRTGETYAFDRNGLLLSRSRFDDDLKRIGLLTDQPHIRSDLNIELRDPGIDMTTGGRPKTRRSQQPLTRMAANAIQGRSGTCIYNTDGHRDYRGVPVVAAWLWLPEYNFGVTTKIDKAEAYRSSTILRLTFWSMLALLGVAAAAIFVFTVHTARLQLDLRKESLAARQLGRYALDEKLGEGGMGVVYRAHHAMLHRPTAIKLLSPEKTTDAAIARFECEVQLTSKLNHPNTITIYDYGRTPEGLFYYAMEYLDGLDLQTLVERHGPQPEGRVVAILTQVCGSLAEAHAIGLVHRDIKPANIHLSRRGGVPDFVKVLDFGLVKAVDQELGAGLTATNSITGTPLYIPPEMIRNSRAVDGRGDLYAVGAVGYFLLTGRPPFDGDNISALLYQQVNQAPIPPSTRLGRPVSADLESALFRCLAKQPEDRFATARALAEALSACDLLDTWTTADAESWWRDYTPSAVPPSPASTPVPAPTSAELQATLAWTSNQVGSAANAEFGDTRPNLDGEHE